MSLLNKELHSLLNRVIERLYDLNSGNIEDLIVGHILIACALIFSILNF